MVNAKRREVQRGVSIPIRRTNVSGGNGSNPMRPKRGALVLGIDVRLGIDEPAHNVEMA